MPRRGRQLYSMVDTQLCVPSKVIERKIHQIRKAEESEKADADTIGFDLARWYRRQLFRTLSSALR